jgi:competence protein ComGF
VLLILKKLFVSNKGFTLLEGLIGLIVMTVLMVLIMQITQVLNKTMVDQTNNKQTIVFTIQMQRDLMTAKQINIVKGNVLIELYDEDVISYKVRGNKLVRQVNNKGSETALYNIEYINFEKINSVLQVKVKYENSKKNYYQILGKEKFK